LPQPSNWTPACTTGSRRWTHPEHPGQPDHRPAPGIAPLIAELRQLPSDERNTIARQLLNKDLAARYIGMAPFIMAALQVRLAQLAATLHEADMPLMQPATVCPVCASEPVASVIRIGGQASGHRYLHCGGCGTDWHMVRVKCSHCESTQGIQYQTIEGDQGVVQAETCTACGSYPKSSIKRKTRWPNPWPTTWPA